MASRQTRGISRLRSVLLLVLLTVVIPLVGCRAKVAGKKQDEFFTSGSREADQRALQRMAQSEQIAGSGEGAGEKGVKKAVASQTGGGANSTNIGARAEGKLPLFDRLGGETGISNIVADVLPRLLQDPRVNWQRKGVKRGVFQSKAASWDAAPESIANLEKHIVQFLALATGGPARYEGKDMTATHSGMNISNPEFDAALGDLKASLDKLRIPNKEQKELLAIIETTRPQVVTRR